MTPYRSVIEMFSRPPGTPQRRDFYLNTRRGVQSPRSLRICVLERPAHVAKMRPMPKPLVRCPWSEGVSDAYLAYHDEEWGVPVRDDRRQFEFLVLEGAQAGLSWS